MQSTNRIVPQGFHLHEFCHWLTKKFTLQNKTSSTATRSLPKTQPESPSLAKRVSNTISSIENGTKKTLSSIHKVLTLNGIINPFKITKSLFAVARTVGSVVWPIFDLGLSFIPGYSQTKALIKALPSIVILTGSSFAAYQGWKLIEHTGLGKAAADAAYYAYESPAGEFVRNLAAKAGSLALSGAIELGKFAFSKLT